MQRPEQRGHRRNTRPRRQTAFWTISQCVSALRPPRFSAFRTCQHSLTRTRRGPKRPARIPHGSVLPSDPAAPRVCSHHPQASAGFSTETNEEETKNSKVPIAEGSSLPARLKRFRRRIPPSLSASALLQGMEQSGSNSECLGTPSLVGTTHRPLPRVPSHYRDAWTRRAICSS